MDGGTFLIRGVRGVLAILVFIDSFSLQPSFLQFRLGRFETSLNLPKEDQIKLKENKVLTDSLENKENNQPNLSSDRSDDQLEESTSKDEIIETNHEAKNVQKKSSGPRALKRRHGRKYNKSALQRRSSFNGHW